MRVKICGLRSRSEVAAAVDAGASYLGFNFFPPSPRYLSVADARWVIPSVPEGVVRVALTVDAPDDLLEALLGAVQIDMLQLHGRESPERVADVRSRFDRPVMKALGIAGEADLEKINAYAAVADQVMIEAAPPRDATRPGGNGLAFDWQLIRGWRWSRPWMLAGGLTPANVAEAIRLTGAVQVDVASGVESRPGYKDAAKVAAFVRSAREAERLDA